MDLSSLDANLSELLNRNPEWLAMSKDLIDHGLGLMTPKQHDFLVSEGMVRCNGEMDSIKSDYPKLRVVNKRGDVEHLDLDGNLELLQKEMKDHTNSRIIWFPRKYAEYLARKNDGWKQEEEASLAPFMESNTKFEDIPIA